MALLTISKRKEYFKFLGLGAYNKANIEKLQRKYFTRKSDIDGIYGANTDILLRHVYNVKKVCKDFTPEEFKCECGGKYCTGYPVQMKAVELYVLQAIRDKYKKPITITSGLRCKRYNNSLPGSIPSSKHTTGYAVDIYVPGATDTLARRKSLISVLKTLPNFDYAYCNGYNSYGEKISASNMDNAIHFQTNAGELPTAKKTETKTVDIGTKVINFAASQKGKYTTRTNHGKDGKKYANKFTKYFAGKGGINSKGQMPTTYGYVPGYCTLFAVYCLDNCKAAVVSELLKNLNSKKKGYWWHAPSLMKYFKKKGLVKTDFSKAKPGAIVFKGTKKNSPTHTCLFLSKSGNKITTWDGNVNGVSKNTRSKSVFLGFVNPPYK